MGVSVWDGMGEPNFIVGVLETVIKRQSVVEVATFAIAVQVLEETVIFTVLVEHLGGFGVVAGLAGDQVLGVGDVLAAALPTI